MSIDGIVAFSSLSLRNVIAIKHRIENSENLDT